ncbi:MAG: hypothetical protein NTV49_01035 [Kiritimatiellaeota bacterium]|nr:hypothetical protein [Kiritimatiellota bacterium]
MNDPPLSTDTPADKFQGKPPADAALPEEKPVSTSGKMTSFTGIRRQLTDDELKSPAVQKLLLDMLEDAARDRDEYKTFVQSFHEADKRASVLAERLNADRSVEVFFGAGMGIGGVLCGFAPVFWAISSSYGIMCLVVGASLMATACIGRLVKR